MAIFHLSMKAVSRSGGRSGTASAAYRSGEKIIDERTGEIHDYTRKGGVESADIVMPDDVPSMSRSDLWNGIELHHKRGDALVAREFEVALPDELSPEERRQLAIDFAREVSNHYKVAADVCVHAPGKEGDSRNHHAHILFTACTVGGDGFGKKAAELDPIHCQRHKIANPAEVWRERWAELVNERLEKNKSAVRVDHRTLDAQGIERQPTAHMGPAVASMERRGKVTEVGKRMIAANRYSTNKQKRTYGQAERKRNFDKSGKLQRYKNGARAVAPSPSTKSIHGLRSMSSLGVVRFTERGAVLLPRDAPGQLEDIRAEPVNPLRRPNAVDGLNLDRLSIEEQEKIFEAARKKLAVQRVKRVEQVLAKAEARQERRIAKANRLERAAPKKPDGMLAALKTKAYQEAAAVWAKAMERAQKLVNQAKQLSAKLNDAVQPHKALGWAQARLRKKDPELVQRIETHRKTKLPPLQREQVKGKDVTK